MRDREGEDRLRECVSCSSTTRSVRKGTAIKKKTHSKRSLADVQCVCVYECAVKMKKPQAARWWRLEKRGDNLTKGLLTPNPFPLCIHPLPSSVHPLWCWLKVFFFFSPPDYIHTDAMNNWGRERGNTLLLLRLNFKINNTRAAVSNPVPFSSFSFYEPSTHSNWCVIVSLSSSTPFTSFFCAILPYCRCFWLFCAQRDKYIKAKICCSDVITRSNVNRSSVINSFVYFFSIPSWVCCCGMHMHYG